MWHASILSLCWRFDWNNRVVQLKCTLLEDSKREVQCDCYPALLETGSAPVSGHLSPLDSDALSRRLALPSPGRWTRSHCPPGSWSASAFVSCCAQLIKSPPHLSGVKEWSGKIHIRESLEVQRNSWLQRWTAYYVLALVTDGRRGRETKSNRGRKIEKTGRGRQFENKIGTMWAICVLRIIIDFLLCHIVQRENLILVNYCFVFSIHEVLIPSSVCVSERNGYDNQGTSGEETAHYNSTILPQTLSLTSIKPPYQKSIEGSSW